jgi:fructose-1,6-bisphosphatase/inositol monophosphatase family enzyme
LTEFGYQRDETKLEIALQCMKALLLRGAHSVRVMGSGVLDLCFVGCGRLDAVYAGVAGALGYGDICTTWICKYASDILTFIRVESCIKILLSH